MQWLDAYAYKAEERLDADADLARKVYTRLAERLAENGTGTVLFFGTIKEETKYLPFPYLYSCTNYSSKFMPTV
jgi:guanine deaminase